MAHGISIIDRHPSPSAGVIGLSCAVELQEAAYRVVLVAKDFPTPAAPADLSAPINYASPWAGAHNRWVLPPLAPAAGPSSSQRDHQLALATFGRMRSLRASHPDAGITLMKGIEYLEDPGPEYQALARRPGAEGSAEALAVEGFRVLEGAELPDDRVKMGFEYDTWCVNPLVYCTFLLNSFVLRGGRTLRRELRRPEEAFELQQNLGGPVGVVVNASGAGFGDPRSYIIRGQTCLVADDCDKTVTRQNADGSWAFCVPRKFGGGTVIGGTKEPDVWDTKPSLETRQTLLRSMLATYPQIADASGSVTVLRDMVGRRPARHGGARLESEDAGGGRTMVHAYGFGGRGYEMSWGVAAMVQNLVGEACPGKAPL